MCIRSNRTSGLPRGRFWERWAPLASSSAGSAQRTVGIFREVLEVGYLTCRPLFMWPHPLAAFSTAKRHVRILFADSHCRLNFNSLAVQIASYCFRHRRFGVVGWDDDKLAFLPASWQSDDRTSENLIVSSFERNFARCALATNPEGSRIRHQNS